MTHVKSAMAACLVDCVRRAITSDQIAYKSVIMVAGFTTIMKSWGMSVSQSRSQPKRMVIKRSITVDRNAKSAESRNIFMPAEPENQMPIPRSSGFHCRIWEPVNMLMAC